MYDNVIIHYYPNEKSGIHAVVSFRKGNKVMISAAMKDVSSALSYMASREFCQGLPYRVITRKH